MTFRQLLDNTRFRTIFVASLVFSALFFVFNIFVMGGNVLYQLVNNIITPVLAVLVVVQVCLIWRDTAPETTARIVWTYLLAGLGAWAAGDLVWAYSALWVHIDIPYPSWADIFWTGGYLFLFVGLYTQFRAYNTWPSRQVWWNIGIFALILTILSAIFVLPSIIQSSDPDSLLNFIYLLLDLVLLPLCFLILGTLSEGKLAIAWKIIALGFMIRGVSDLMFPSIALQGIYQTGGNINLVSAMYDFVYSISYVVAGLGFVSHWLLTLEAPQPVAEVAAEAEQPDTVKNLILISTDAENRIISFSNNLLALLDRKDSQNIKGASLYEVLGMTDGVIKSMEAELREHGIVDALLFPVKNTEGGSIDVRLSALAVYYEGKSFKGANIVLGTLSPLGVKDNLSIESQGVIRSILLRTGNPQKETRTALSIYFNAQLHMLDDLVRQYGGRTVAQTMRMVINETAVQSGWLVRKEGGDFAILDQADTMVLAAAMSALLAAARAYGVEMVGAQMVNTEIGRVNDHMNPAVMKAVDEHSLRLVA